MQLPNILKEENKHKCTAKNIRLQTVDYIATNCHVLLDEVKPNLECKGLEYKEYLGLMVEDDMCDDEIFLYWPYHILLI